jgi:hydroxymethylbilane synthase
MYKVIRIGTRGSLLALTQTEIVINSLSKIFDSIKLEIHKIKTSGDIHQDKSIFDESLKNMFVKEIEMQLLEGKVDIVVHSMKDMPEKMPDGLITGAIPVREDPRDILISKGNIKLNDLPENSIIGTSSLRRKFFLKDLRPDIIIKEIRGNIHTRINKLNEDYDAIILAAAGVKRVNLQNKITEYFDIDEIIPSSAQGALCVQCRKDDREIIDMLKKINDEKSEIEVNVEREFSKMFNGGCKAPVGANASILKNKIYLHGMIVKDNKIYKAKLEREKSDYKIIAEKLAEILRGKLND